MSYQHLIYEVDKQSHIATITLNKPERLNAIDLQDHRDILDVCRRIQQEDDVWVAVWTGAGRGFCSGADVGRRPAEELAAESAVGQELNQLLTEDSWISLQGKALYSIDKSITFAYFIWFNLNPHVPELTTTA